MAERSCALHNTLQGHVATPALSVRMQSCLVQLWQIGAVNLAVSVCDGVFEADSPVTDPGHNWQTCKGAGSLCNCSVKELSQGLLSQGSAAFGVQCAP